MFRAFIFCSLSVILSSSLTAQSRPMLVSEGAGYEYYMGFDPQQVGFYSELFGRAMPLGLLIRLPIEKGDFMDRYIQSLEVESKKHGEELSEEDKEKMRKNFREQIEGQVNWMNRQNNQMGRMLRDSEEAPESAFRTFEQQADIVKTDIRQRLWFGSSGSSTYEGLRQIFSPYEALECLRNARRDLQALLDIEEALFETKNGSFEFKVTDQQSEIYGFPETGEELQVAYERVKQRYLAHFDENATFPCLDEIGAQHLSERLDFSRIETYRVSSSPISHPYILLILSKLIEISDLPQSVTNYMALASWTFSRPEALSAEQYRLMFKLWWKAHESAELDQDLQALVKSWTEALDETSEDFTFLASLTYPKFIDPSDGSSSEEDGPND